MSSVVTSRKPLPLVATTSLLPYISESFVSSVPVSIYAFFPSLRRPSLNSVTSESKGSANLEPYIPPVGFHHFGCKALQHAFLRYQSEIR